MATGSAGGKVILFGEHFVVHGVPAIAAGISQTSVVEVERSDKMLFICEKHKTIPELTYASINNVLGAMGINGNFKVTLTGNLLTVGGLGSSAAFCVAMAIAFAKDAGLTLTHEQINKYAYEGEKAFHGNPSGIDNVMATYGGVMKYTRGKTASENDFKKLRVKTQFYIVVGVTGKSSPTVQMVSKVAEFKIARPDEFASLSKAATKIVSEAESALSKGGLSDLGALFDQNQLLLERVGVCAPENMKIISAAKTAGALGAKVTGGGGGGCCIALAKDKEHAERILSAIKKQGFDGFITIVS